MFKGSFQVKLAGKMDLKICYSRNVLTYYFSLGDEVDLYASYIY